MCIGGMCHASLVEHSLGCFPSLGNGLEPAHSHTHTQSPSVAKSYTSVGHLFEAGGNLNEIKSTC